MQYSYFSDGTNIIRQSTFNDGATRDDLLAEGVSGRHRDTIVLELNTLAALKEKQKS